jgi:hypothetical protein
MVTNPELNNTYGTMENTTFNDHNQSDNEPIRNRQNKNTLNSFSSKYPWTTKLKR